jgi:hypothetical protein
MPEIRAATLPGTPGRDNEDAYAVLASLVVIADGATSPAQLGDGCVHGPAWYARRLVANTVAAHVEEPVARPAYLLAEAITRTTAAHADTCDVDHPGTPSATVAMLTVDQAHTAHWLVLGDCTLLLDTDQGLRVVCDDRLSNTSHAERAALLSGEAAVSSDEHGRRIAALVEAQRQHRNRPGGFWVAATDSQAAHNALTGSQTIGPAGLHRAALLTDGAARLVDTYRLTDWPTALQQMAEEGPARLLHAVRAAEVADPDGARFRRIKGSDDATALLVTWPSEQP